MIRTPDGSPGAKNRNHLVKSLKIVANVKVGCGLPMFSAD